MRITLQYICGIVLTAYMLSFPASAQTITWLGSLSPDRSSEAYGVSADGSVVVGISWNKYNQPCAFRWTRGTGMQQLPGLNIVGQAFAVSRDGSTIAGGMGTNTRYETGFYHRAFRWTTDQGVQDIGTLGGSDSTALAVSADGNVVVGVSWNATNNRRAFRWTKESGMTDIGTLTGAYGSAAYGVSADGTRVVGTSVSSGGQWRAFLWTEGDGMRNLGSLSMYESEARAVSDDGRTVVGWSRNYWSYRRAFRWTPEDGMIDLGALNSAKPESEAFAVSADGSIIVGRSREPWQLHWHAVRWTTLKGIEDLNVTYSSILNGEKLFAARAISPDGRYIVGLGSRGAFLLDTAVIPEPASWVLFLCGLGALWKSRPKVCSINRRKACSRS